jgi:hypothetical protein
MIPLKMFPEAQTPEERKIMLSHGCRKKEQQDIKKYLTEGEHLQMRKDFMANAIKLGKLKDELKTISDDFASRMKPLQIVNDELKAKVDKGFEEVPGDVFLFDFQDDGMMVYYDENGDQITSRRLAPEEKQIDLIREASKA